MPMGNDRKRSLRLGRGVSAAAASLVLALALSGCGTSSTPDLDPSGFLDFLDTKKPLPGERKPVFPEGVPGVERGVPKELTKTSVITRRPTSPLWSPASRCPTAPSATWSTRRA